MAVGLTLQTEDIAEFKKEFHKIISDAKKTGENQVVYIDKQIEQKDLAKEVVERIQLLEPFGEDNNVPIFIYKDIKIDSIRTLSEGKHLKLTLIDDGYIINAIGFNIGNLADEYLVGDKVDLLGQLEINSFNGIDSVQINLKDMRKTC